jgi:hypothetical protein
VIYISLDNSRGFESSELTTRYFSISRLISSFIMFSRLLFVLPLLFSIINAYSNPGSCSGNCYAHDPSLIQRSSDGTWFRFNTGNGIGIWKATSLAGSWTYVGDALPGGSSIALTGNTDLWVCKSFTRAAKMFC